VDAFNCTKVVRWNVRVYKRDEHSDKDKTLVISVAYLFGVSLPKLVKDVATTCWFIDVD
jgi:hypothetical protein